MMEQSSPPDLPPPPEPFRQFTERYPSISEAYERLAESVRESGQLSDREIALVKLGLTLGAALKGVTQSHTRKALAIGVEPESLRHAALLALPTLGFPRMRIGLGWIEEELAARGRD